MRRIAQVAMVAVLLGLVVANLPLAVSAQASLSISPLRQEYEAKPGDTIQGTIEVTNRGSASSTVSVIVRDFEVSGESGYPQFSDTPIGGPSYSLADWTTVGEESIVIAPGETAKVNFTISVPQNAEPGGHYAGILVGSFSPQVLEGKESTMVAIGSATASLILLTV